MLAVAHKRPPCPVLALQGAQDCREAVVKCNMDNPVTGNCLSIHVYYSPAVLVSVLAAVSWFISVHGLKLLIGAGGLVVGGRGSYTQHACEHTCMFSYTSLEMPPTNKAQVCLHGDSKLS